MAWGAQLISKVAYRYATSLFSFLESTSQRTKARKEALLLQKVIEKDPKGWAAVSGPLLNRSQQQTVVEAWGKSLKLSPLFQDFLRLLVKGRRLYELPTILKILQRRLDQAEGILSGVLITAHPLHKNEISVFKKKAEHLLQKKLAITYKTQEEILGGYILDLEGVMVDASLLHQLEKLKHITQEVD